MRPPFSCIQVQFPNRQEVNAKQKICRCFVQKSCTMHLIPEKRNSFKQTSYRPIADNGSTLLYNLEVPEIPVRRPSKQIKNSAHYSNGNKRASS